MNCGCNVNGSRSQRGIVREEYGKIAWQGGSCCGPPAEAVAAAVGYREDELAGLPDGANMGSPAGTRPRLHRSSRETSCSTSAPAAASTSSSPRGRSAPRGRAIGVDMTPDMVDKARRNAESFRKSSGMNNVEFRLGGIEHLPVADASGDVVTSDCVINPSPDKPKVWQEIARVLKPRGRVAVSDLALLRPLPEALRESVHALIRCVAAAALVDETKEMVRAAGPVEVVFETKFDYIDRMADWSDPLCRGIAEKLPPGTKLSDFVTSMSITARKPTVETGAGP